MHLSVEWQRGPTSHLFGVAQAHESVNYYCMWVGRYLDRDWRRDGCTNQWLAGQGSNCYERPQSWDPWTLGWKFPVKFDGGYLLPHSCIQILGCSQKLVFLVSWSAQLCQTLFCMHWQTACSVIISENHTNSLWLSTCLLNTRTHSHLLLHYNVQIFSASSSTRRKKGCEN